MSESEAWDSLAKHLKQKNYTGVLVLADWFQENGKEEVAVYLRWATKKDMLPYLVDASLWWVPNVDDNYGGECIHSELALVVSAKSGDLTHWRRWYSD